MAKCIAGGNRTVAIRLFMLQKPHYSILPKFRGWMSRRAHGRVFAFTITRKEVGSCWFKHYHLQFSEIALNSKTIPPNWKVIGALKNNPKYDEDSNVQPILLQRLLLLVLVLSTPCLACFGGGGCCCCMAGSKNIAARGRPIPLGGDKMMAMAGGGGGISMLGGAVQKGFIAPHRLHGSAHIETHQKT